MVRNQHRSKEFIEFLNEVDKHYPQDWLLRIVLDNHSSHVSKETTAFLLSKTGRFEFVFTPKHGSWLNMIEMFFSKIARSFLRHIRVESKDELVKRIYQGIEDFNKEPVIFRWKYKMEEVELFDMLYFKNDVLVTKTFNCRRNHIQINSNFYLRSF